MSEGTLRLSLARPVIRHIVNGAARRGLRTHMLTNVYGSSFRWLDHDINRFVAALSLEVRTLRKDARLESLPTFGSQLMVELAVWTAAADRTLRDHGVAPASSRQIVADLGWDIYRRLLKLASAPFRLVTTDPGKRLRWTIGALLVFPFSARGKPGYEVTVTRQDDSLMTHFTFCPPQSFVRRISEIYDDPDALQAFRESWCLYDWPGADLIAGDGERGHYERPHTLSFGDTVCDMCWISLAGSGSNESKSGK